MTKAKSQAVSTVEQNDQLPAFLQNQTTTRGSEDVGTDDLVIPRLELCQALSPCLKKKDPAYIEGIEEGMLYNNITREIYGPSVVVCPVIFKKEYLLWRDRKNDVGGFHGAYSGLDDAEAARADLERPENVEAVDTHQHFCLIVNTATGETEEIAISMARSKRKPSKNWNSLIRINGGDRFSRLYVVASVDDSSDQGDYQNLQVSNFGFVTEEIYRKAEELYEAVSAGHVSVDRTEDERTGDTIDGEAEEETGEF